MNRLTEREMDGRPEKDTHTQRDRAEFIRFLCLPWLQLRTNYLPGTKLTLMAARDYSQKTFLGGDLLCVRASCQCSSGAQEAVRTLVESSCTTLVGSISEVLKTITF